MALDLPLSVTKCVDFSFSLRLARNDSIVEDDSKLFKADSLNFSLSFCFDWKYVAPPVRQRPQAANASPGGKLSRIGTSEPILD